MKVTYKTKKLERTCTDYTYAQKSYGMKNAEILQQRIGELEAADSLEMMIKFRIGRCHKLQGNRANQYALDLVHPFRLIVTKVEENIEIVKILEIVDYH